MARKMRRVSLFVAANAVGRPRVFGSPEEMAQKWDEYTQMCDEHVRYQTLVDKDSGASCEVEVLAPLTYTIEGFCLSVPISMTAFDKTYRDDPEYAELIQMMEQMTHIDARSKFEDGTLNPKLAGLWMGRHKGYSTKAETEIKGGVPVVISGEDALED